MNISIPVLPDCMKHDASYLNYCDVNLCIYSAPSIAPVRINAGAAAGGVIVSIVLIIAGIVGILGAMYLFKRKEKKPLFRLAWTVGYLDYVMTYLYCMTYLDHVAKDPYPLMIRISA